MGDSVSRAGVIDEIVAWTVEDRPDVEMPTDLIGRIENLPSAEPEIIRCTECKHYREYDSEYVENAVVVQCMADRYPISKAIPDGWFCAGAERSSDG